MENSYNIQEIRIFKFIKRHLKRHKALRRGPKFKLGDVVMHVYAFTSHYETVTDIRFRHKNTLNQVVNEWQYYLDSQEAWFDENSLNKIKFIEGFDEQE